MQTQQTALKEVINRLQAPEDVMQFAEHFYKFAALEELTNWQEDTFYGATLSTWRFLQNFNNNTPKIRLFNPDINLDGWQSPHTFIQLLNTDMPLLVDSLRLLINRRHLTLHSLNNAIFTVQRTSEGELKTLAAASEATNQPRESLILIEIDALTDPQEIQEIQEELLTALDEVRLAVNDFAEMQNHALTLSQQLKTVAEQKLPFDNDLVNLHEVSEFFNWLAKKHFIFLGYDSYQLEEKDGQASLKKIAGSELGLLKLSNKNQANPSSLLTSPTPDLLTFAKASTIARVHRAAFPDQIIVKTFDATGKVIGEARFVGLYTSAVYNKIPRDIPVLRKKVTQVVKNIGTQPRSHSGRQLLQILDSYPRDDLFQIGIEELSATALSIFNLRERRKTRVFIRQDQPSKLYSVLVYLPKDTFTTSLQLKIQNLLSQQLDAEFVDFFVHFSASALCRMQFILHYQQDSTPAYDLASLEQQLVQAAASWEDSLHSALSENQGEASATQLMRRYHQGFSAAYCEDFTPQHAVKDLAFLEALNDEQPLAMNLYRRADNIEQLGFKIFHLNQRLWLSDILPVLENLGLKVMGEDPYKITSSEKVSWIHDFFLDLALEDIRLVDLEAVKDKFQTAFLQTWQGNSESDAFNKLVLAAQLNWRQIALLRGYARYMKQIGASYSQDFIAATLVNQPTITQQLVALFALRFNPDLTPDDKAYAACLAKIEAELEGVASLTEDRVLRCYIELIQATLRTNFYQQDEAGNPKPAISYKLNPSAISNIPQPAPMFEIFVSSPRVEGVHLRYGQAARGGLRWSDRQEDFRTEVLGLVKAQQVKNAVIVPVGAKGGFICKQMPSNPDREAFMAEGIACYKTFISCLLDVTDNLVNGEVVPPQRLVRQDGDDTYLVVAADKGTATFSDIANGIAEEYNFWLGDAFASGGSAGYDHKKMGITAGGAWVSVQRHFRELGINVQEETFSVVGIGDMGGDVFGNGMLQSDKILLTAAFNHLHIFVDPNPADSVASFKERQRLFNLPRSGWNDYAAELISKGGGVFSRDAKSINISPEMQARFAITEDQLAPSELISALLKAPIDLIWNGGIGTYVKGSEESHAQVGDKANDNLRVDGNQLRCRVVGEGGNLGFTQLGRIEAAKAGTRINTDFIDNAGGVNCSDHEVNIKILLQEVMQAGDLTLKQRNELLVEMTSEVSRLVLRDNYTQSQALAIAELNSRKDLTTYQNLINQLEKEGKLNRELEYLPSEAELNERAAAKAGLTRPELAIVLAYAKADVKQQILDSDLPEDPWLAKAMKQAFPEVLVERYPTVLANHRLKRELVATMLVNQLVDHLGITFVHQLQATSKLSISDIIRGYAASRDIFNLEATWQAINDLDYQVEASLQLELMQQLAVGVEKSIGWLVAEGLTKEDLTKEELTKEELTKKKLTNNAEQSIKNLSPENQEALESLAGINQLEAALNKLQTSNE